LIGLEGGVVKDDAKAIECFIDAAKRGHVGAKTLLSKKYDPNEYTLKGDTYKARAIWNLENGKAVLTEYFREQADKYYALAENIKVAGKLQNEEYYNEEPIFKSKEEVGTKLIKNQLDDVKQALPEQLLPNPEVKLEKPTPEPAPEIPETHIQNESEKLYISQAQAYMRAATQHAEEGNMTLANHLAAEADEKYLLAEDVKLAEELQKNEDLEKNKILQKNLLPTSKIKTEKSVTKVLQQELVYNPAPAGQFFIEKDNEEAKTAYISQSFIGKGKEIIEEEPAKKVINNKKEVLPEQLLPKPEVKLEKSTPELAPEILETHIQSESEKLYIFQADAYIRAAAQHAEEGNMDLANHLAAEADEKYLLAEDVKLAEELQKKEHVEQEQLILKPKTKDEKPATKMVQQPSGNTPPIAQYCVGKNDKEAGSILFKNKLDKIREVAEEGNEQTQFHPPEFLANMQTNTIEKELINGSLKEGIFIESDPQKQLFHNSKIKTIKPAIKVMPQNPENNILTESMKYTSLGNDCRALAFQHENAGHMDLAQHFTEKANKMYKFAETAKLAEKP